MPNDFDFSKLSEVKEVVVNPDGWNGPLIVECGIGNFANDIPSYYWRVKGTTHTFVIPVIRMDYLTEGDHVKHFEEALQGFREDYSGWADEGWYAPWMQEYRKQFSRFIRL